MHSSFVFSLVYPRYGNRSLTGNAFGAIERRGIKSVPSMQEVTMLCKQGIGPVRTESSIG